MRTFVRHNGYLLYVAAGIELLRGKLTGMYWSRCFGVSSIHIRKGAYLRGIRHIRIGENFDAGRGLWMEAVTSWQGNESKPEIQIGNNVSISFWGHIAALTSVRIGNGVMIGSKVTILDHDHGSYNGTECSSPHVAPGLRPLEARPIIIGDNVWLADGVVVTGGSTIGEGCIIGANAVVRGSIPPYSIAVGIPARPVKRYDHDRQEWISIQ